MADSEFVTLRHEGTREEIRVFRDAAPGFTNQGYVVIDKAGRPNPKAAAPADTSKEN